VSTVVSPNSGRTGRLSGGYGESGGQKKSPDGACGRFESGRAAPPVKAGPSGPVVPGPSQAATLLLRVHWPRRPPPHRSP